MEQIFVDVITGEKTIVPLTDAEVAIAQANTVTWNAQQAEKVDQEQAQTNAKASALAKLAALGLTQDEVKALVG